MNLPHNICIELGAGVSCVCMVGGVRYSDRIRKIRSSRLKNVAEQAADENAKTA
ncbi:hypothetical protein [Nostoc sp.]|uniref:hypothetical protein n=1 Tax=Nostoc sp. TaxID=1180 RepID=UPI002FF66D16